MTATATEKVEFTKQAARALFLYFADVEDAGEVPTLDGFRDYLEYVHESEVDRPLFMEAQFIEAVARAVKGE